MFSKVPEDILKTAPHPGKVKRRDLVKRAMSRDDDLLYVAAIGAITNVASAILMKPEIINKIVVVWLGGHALNWKDTREYNLHQDIHASRIIFNSEFP